MFDRGHRYIHNRLSEKAALRMTILDEVLDFLLSGQNLLAAGKPEARRPFTLESILRSTRRSIRAHL